jgi:alkanesulfonate monooxygenase SsuD/methylene tetrahydromethanopterin reductase-like flavin-dependent oxidoreductase (luciferase family)
VFQEFATLDLISSGRAEIVAGRGSSIEPFPLFGFDLDDYDSLFAEKLDLLLRIRDNTRHSLERQVPRSAYRTGRVPASCPRSASDLVGVGGTPASFVRAGTLGLPTQKQKRSSFKQNSFTLKSKAGLRKNTPR